MQPCLSLKTSNVVNVLMKLPLKYSHTHSVASILSILSIVLLTKYVILKTSACIWSRVNPAHSLEKFWLL